jgi:hypothetical protein
LAYTGCCILSEEKTFNPLSTRVSPLKVHLKVATPLLNIGFMPKLALVVIIATLSSKVPFLKNMLIEN